MPWARIASSSAILYILSCALANVVTQGPRVLPGCHGATAVRNIERERGSRHIWTESEGGGKAKPTVLVNKGV